MPLSSQHMLDHREQAIETVHRALDLGITLLDTANIYAPSWAEIGHNERLVAEALRCYRGSANLQEVLVTTKGGITRGPGESWGRDSRPDALRAACQASLEALGVDIIDLYQHHRHDPSLTYAEQMHALASLRQEGLVRMIGLSNVTGPELDLALDLLGGPADGGVVSVQNEYSPRYRGEADVLERCTQLQIAFLPWSPLGGAGFAQEVGSRYAEFAEVAVEVSASAQEVPASAQEVALAWLLAMSPVMIPIPGATRPSTVESIVRAAALELSAEQLGRLDDTAPEGTSMYPDEEPRSPLA
jgi:aryl-alcohol dehydrogenase-like predicted oxidoreductase